jgi:redox-sensitive bicupin YhaK (pirin superfamily)
LDNGKVTAYIISGDWNGVKGCIHPLTDVHLASIYFEKGGKVNFSVPKSKNIFLYVVKGEISVNGKDVRMHNLVEFANDAEEIQFEAITDCIVLFGHATPFKEPFAANGPFVMNTREEIMQAYDDYNKGTFGSEII